MEPMCACLSLFSDHYFLPDLVEGKPYWQNPCSRSGTANPEVSTFFLDHGHCLSHFLAVFTLREDEHSLRRAPDLFSSRNRYVYWLSWSIAFSYLSTICTPYHCHSSRFFHCHHFWGDLWVTAADHEKYRSCSARTWPTMARRVTNLGPWKLRFCCCIVPSWWATMYPIKVRTFVDVGSIEICCICRSIVIFWPVHAWIFGRFCRRCRFKGTKEGFNIVFSNAALCCWVHC